jgi:lia operon protein LiaG
MKCLAAFTAIAALTTALLAGQQAERHTLQGPDIAIYNLAGRMTLERGTGSDVVVLVTRGGADAAKLRIETGTIGGRATLRVIYPEDHITYTDGRGYGSSSTLRVRDDGTFGDGDAGRGARREGREVRVSTRAGGLEAHADLRILVPVGQRIAGYLGVGQAAVTGVEGDLRVDVAAADVTVARTKGDLVVDTGSGEIELTEHEGQVLLDTGSGAVHATRVRGPKLHIDTGSGEVTVDGAEVRELLIDTGSGSVDATAVRAGDILIDTGSGSVTLGVLEDVQSLAIDTGSGSVTLSLPAAVGAMIDVQTGSGDIDLGFPVEATRMSRSHLQGKIGDGQGRIVVDTGSGSISLRRS